VFPDVLADRIRSVLVAAGVTSTDEEAVRVARPLRSEHGDYSTPVALRLARTTGRDPAELAEIVAAGLRADDGIEEATVAAGGHVNLRFTPNDLAETARELSRRPPAAGPPGETPETPGTSDTSETRAELARLLRGADALGVPEEPVDVDDLSAPAQRQLICVLAETAGLAKRKPERLPSHFAEIVLLWQRVEMVQPILPAGDEIPTIRHSSGRLLAAATRAALSGVEASP
jgi:hypothetical protein